MKPGSPKDTPYLAPVSVPEELLRVIEAEGGNFAQTTAYLGSTLELVKDFSELYRHLIDSIAISGTGKKPKNEEQQYAAVASLHLLMKSQKDFTIGVLNVLRGYRGMGLIVLRSATEAGAFAARIMRCPHLGNVWLDAAKGEEEYAKYKDKFTRLFPKDDVLLNQLYEYYDRCSQAMHTSIYSMAGHVTYGPQGQETVIKVNAFDLPEGPHIVPVLYYTLDAHKLILRVFARSLKPHIKELIVWETRYNSVEAKLDVHRDKWKPVVGVPEKEDA
jgi:hypothetical protein